MRLFHTEKLEVFSLGDDAVPPYAILSHTWGAGEVSLQDMQGIGGKLRSAASRMGLMKKKPGLQKVIDAARLAAAAGYQWIWIDTCCIDKTSSAELSEAINSMYRWYEAARVCYVFLEDVVAGPDRKARPPSRGAWDTQEDVYAALGNSRWASRGWTLQELIAPRSVKFYSWDWTYMGSRSDQAFLLALRDVTGIEIGVLSGQVTAWEVSVANRMKWASSRQTTRPEDIAYCLMGMFGVNMPLLYGEGGVRAFIRLQEQILKATDDQSIFAWKLPRGEIDPGMHGLLASSPTYFSAIRSIYLMATGFQSASSVPWSMTNKGLQVQLYIRPEKLSVDDESYIAVLDCFQDRRAYETDTNASAEEYSPAIHLRRLWGDQYTRIQSHICESIGERDRYLGGRHESFFVKQNPMFSLPQVAVPEIWRRQEAFDSGHWHLQGVFPTEVWNQDAGTMKISLSRAHGIQGLFRFMRRQYLPLKDTAEEEEVLDVAIVLHRTARADLEAVCFPRPPEGSSVEQAYYKLNMKWRDSALEEQDRLFREYQGRIMVVTEMSKTVREGRGLYLLNLRERYELSGITGLRLYYEVDATPLDSQSLERAKTAIKTEMEADAQKTPVLKDMDGSELELDRKLPRVSMKHSDTAAVRDSLQQKVKDSLADIQNDNISKFIHLACEDDTPEPDAILEQLSLSDITEVALTFDGFYLIHIAVVLCSPLIVTKLLEKGADPLVETSTGLNALHLAAILGNADMVQPILHVAPPLDDRRDTFMEFLPLCVEALSRFRLCFASDQSAGDTALHLAAVHCSAAEFQAFIKEIFGAAGLQDQEVDLTQTAAAREIEYLVNLRNDAGETVLHKAASAGNISVVVQICEAVPETVRQFDFRNRSSLWHAANGGEGLALQAIQRAWTSGTLYTLDPLTKDDDGLDPLHVACWRGHAGCVRELAGQMRTWNLPVPRTPLHQLSPFHYAALRGHHECLEALADVLSNSQFRSVCNSRALYEPWGFETFTAIHLAAANGWLECVRVLAANGAVVLNTTACYYRLPPRQDRENGLEAQAEGGWIWGLALTPEEIAEKEGHSDIAAFFTTLSI